MRDPNTVMLGHRPVAEAEHVPIASCLRCRRLVRLLRARDGTTRLRGFASFECDAVRAYLGDRVGRQPIASDDDGPYWHSCIDAAGRAAP